ncbi:NAD-dependent dehydratase [Nocardia donostiensis]|uniref:NAD-dependent epimerase/dehydratase family protein n=1 Tax=Nocardia donostiensis TaxID=1538463 RepID=UPI0009DB5F69|nr:NAD-dependent epimerase/dehydratase family protein [Nocardia donostiensis]OQS13100.1 NAD-dependent dehydratase [Nocardia donostiensis]
MGGVRVLLTGAAGFIGSHVHRALRDSGHDVVAVDVMLDAAHGPAAAAPEGVRRIDVRDSAALDGLLTDVDVVCHQAAVVGAGVSAQDAPAYASHNDYGTAVLLAAMDRAGCRRLVLASSMVVYGEGRYRGRRCGMVQVGARLAVDLAAGMYEYRCGEETLEWVSVPEETPSRPRSVYAASKVAQENYAAAWAAATGGCVTALRYHNVYGDGMPRDTPYSGVAAIFRSAVEAGRAPQVFEDGGQMRDFVHVSDVAEANRAAVEQPLPGFVPLNICSGHPIAIGEVAATLARAHGGPEPVVTGRVRAGDVRHIVADPAQAARVLGFTARVRPADGLARFASAPLRESAAAAAPSA